MKQTSVGYSQQTNGLKNSFVSCDWLNTRPFTNTNIPVESRSSGDGQTDDEEELSEVNYRITPDIQSKINSNSSNEVKVFLGNVNMDAKCDRKQKWYHIAKYSNKNIALMKITINH